MYRFITLIALGSVAIPLSLGSAQDLSLSAATANPEQVPQVTPADPLGFAANCAAVTEERVREQSLASFVSTFLSVTQSLSRAYFALDVDTDSEPVGSLALNAPSNSLQIATVQPARSAMFRSRPGPACEGIHFTAEGLEAIYQGALARGARALQSLPAWIDPEKVGSIAQAAARTRDHMAETLLTIQQADASCRVASALKHGFLNGYELSLVLAAGSLDAGSAVTTYEYVPVDDEHGPVMSCGYTYQRFRTVRAEHQEHVLRNVFGQWPADEGGWRDNVFLLLDDALNQLALGEIAIDPTDPMSSACDVMYDYPYYCISDWVHEYGSNDPYVFSSIFQPVSPARECEPCMVFNGAYQAHGAIVGLNGWFQCVTNANSIPTRCK